MEKVSAFKTSDGRVFENPTDALNHEMIVNFRGIINRGKEKGLSPEVSLCQEIEFLYTTIREYKKRVGPWRKSVAQRRKTISS